jgi:hypothetical protein
VHTFLGTFHPNVTMMARRKTRETPELNAGQAQYVVRRLIADRQVSASQVRGYLDELQTEIATLEQKLDMLRAASSPASRRSASGARTRSAGRHRNLSPERRESLRLQGHYLALIRQVPARQRPQYKAIVAKRGKEAAIAALRRAVGS